MGAQSDDSHKLPRPSRPNYNKLHAQPLPVKTYPLPPLIPHNPLSLLHIAFTYISQLVFPPLSHPQPLLRAYFSAETRSIHVTDEKTARTLWEHGFFGKGSLSRSEPAWLEREKIRQGLALGDTSEEATRRRREERKQFKNERARNERQAIEEKLAEEAIAGSDRTGNNIGNGTIEPSEAIGVDPPRRNNEIDSQGPSPVLAPLSSENTLSLEVDEQIPFLPSEKASGLSILQDPTKVLVNQEHLQLTVEEAFFLVYALGVLEIQDPSTSGLIPTSLLFSICRSHSYFPPQPSSSLAPDDPFLLSYVVYHHFRSLGWVVRPGIKFAVDYLLYNRGPVFSHAEFAVIILPAYNDAHWSSTAELQATVKKKGKKSWWWLHCVNRVQAHVKKSLVLVYVEVPPPVSGDDSIINEVGDVVDIGRFLKRYRVRELMVKRWAPNRNKD
ncbi:MAG: hypothetical protein L6R40_004564 [Gallowayella cf. fulva]|nr:MAG: hypothetical protein L6R40_004564 [Xanthomendoza cf. fulva]